jgi:hypothetical protein
MEAALDAAKSELRRADMIAGNLARMLSGRLRKVDSGNTLAELKRELRDFNGKTRTWKV